MRAGGMWEAMLGGGRDTGLHGPTMDSGMDGPTMDGGLHGPTTRWPSVHAVAEELGLDVGAWQHFVCVRFPSHMPCVFRSSL